jgi:thiol-disulfide isomerase/thioredoxin
MWCLFGTEIGAWILSLEIMKKLFVIVLVAVFGYGFGQQKNTEITKLDKLQKLISAKSDGILIVNFWATWCAPCVKELPLFEKVNAEAKGVSVALVSMDLDIDPNPEKVYKFVERKGLKSKVLLLDEKDPNSWIASIDPEWSGALPATIVINQKTGKRKFVERSMHEGDLEKLIAEVQ